MKHSFSCLATALALILVVFAADTVSHAQNRERGRRGERGERGERGDRAGQGGRGGRGGFGGGRRGGGTDASSLLRSEQVQKELGLSESQISELTSIAEEAREKSREIFGGMRDLSESERAARREELQKQRAEMQSELRQKLATVMSDTQMKRLDEITLQIRGISSLLDAELGAKLSITEEQKQSISDIVEAQREMQRELFGSMRDLRDLDAEERTAKIAELREKGEEIGKETEAAVLDVLSEQQQATYVSMKGSPFEFDRQSLFGGRGGQNGRRERGRRGGEGGGRPSRPQRPDAV